MLHVINVKFNGASSEMKEKSFLFLSTSCSAVYLVGRHCKLLAEVAVIFPHWIYQSILPVCTAVLILCVRA